MIHLTTLHKLKLTTKDNSTSLSPHISEQSCTAGVRSLTFLPLAFIYACKAPFRWCRSENLEGIYIPKWGHNAMEVKPQGSCSVLSRHILSLHMIRHLWKYFLRNIELLFLFNVIICEKKLYFKTFLLYEDLCFKLSALVCTFDTKGVNCNLMNNLDH